MKKLLLYEIKMTGSIQLCNVTRYKEVCITIIYLIMEYSIITRLKEDRGSAFNSLIWNNFIFLYGNIFD